MLSLDLRTIRVRNPRFGISTDTKTTGETFLIGNSHGNIRLTYKAAHPTVVAPVGARKPGGTHVPGPSQHKTSRSVDNRGPIDVGSSRRQHGGPFYS